MTRIADIARIVQNGKVKSATALKAAVAPVEHVAPCPDMLTTCIDLECQVRKGLREHLLLNIAEKDRPQASRVALARLSNLLADASLGDATPEQILALTIEGITTDVAHAANCVCALCFSENTPFIQAAKASLTTTTKAVRTPRVAKHQPRIIDNQEHPVTEKITMTKAEMERAIKDAADLLVEQRVQEILATKTVHAADKPVEIVKATGGRAKVQRATAKDREYIGTTLPAIVVNEALTIPALEVGEESVDTVTTPKVRSPYNKARYRLDKTPTPLEKDVTYRTLIAEHLRIAALVGAASGTKTTKVAAKVVVDDSAKRKAQVKVLMSTLGLTKSEAKALLASK